MLVACDRKPVAPPMGAAATPSNPELLHVVGSAKSTVYHRPSCVWAEKISPSNLVTFSSREEAEAAGYRPCKVCKP